MLTVLTKLLIIAFLLFWMGLGAWMLIRFEGLFRNDPGSPPMGVENSA